MKDPLGVSPSKGNQGTTRGGHAEDHVILILPEQLHTSRDSIRKAREAFLIKKHWEGKTLEPASLNRRDEM